MTETTLDPSLGQQLCTKHIWTSWFLKEKKVYFIFRRACLGLCKWVPLSLEGRRVRSHRSVDSVPPHCVATRNELGLLQGHCASFTSGPSLQFLFLIINMVLPSFYFLPLFWGFWGSNPGPVTYARWVLYQQAQPSVPFHCLSCNRESWGFNFWLSLW